MSEPQAIKDRKPRTKRDEVRDRRENGPWLLPPPWLPVDYELPDVSALQAMQAGTATPEQQKRALRWIVRSAAGYADLGWHPEAGLKDFAAGRRFVALQIEKLLHMDKSILKSSKGEPVENP